MEKIFTIRKSKKYKYFQPVDSLDMFMNLSLTLTLTAKDTFKNLTNEEFDDKFKGEDNKGNKFIHKYGNNSIIYQDAYIQLRKDQYGNDINFNYYLPYINQDILNFVLYKYNIDEYHIIEETRRLPSFNNSEIYLMNKLYYKIKKILNKIYIKTPKDTNDHHFYKYIHYLPRKATLKNKEIRIYNKLNHLGNFQVR